MNISEPRLPGIIIRKPQPKSFGGMSLVNGDNTEEMERRIPSSNCVIREVCDSCENMVGTSGQERWCCRLQKKGSQLCKTLYRGFPIPTNCPRQMEMIVLSQESATPSKTEGEVS